MNDDEQKFNSLIITLILKQKRKSKSQVGGNAFQLNRTVQYGNGSGIFGYSI